MNEVLESSRPQGGVGLKLNPSSGSTKAVYRLALFPWIRPTLVAGFGS